jgi:hypothetical protein
VFKREFENLHKIKDAYKKIVLLMYENNFVDDFGVEYINIVK